MKRRIPLLIALATPIAVAAFAFISTSRAATETPDYKVVRKDGDVEIRDYPALTIATVPMSDGEMDRGFSQLFRYITGSNEHSEKIEMTAPRHHRFGEGCADDELHHAEAKPSKAACRNLVGRA